jgi:hypothetical protein
MSLRITTLRYTFLIRQVINTVFARGSGSLGIASLHTEKLRFRELTQEQGLKRRR